MTVGDLLKWNFETPQDLLAKGKERVLKNAQEKEIQPLIQELQDFLNSIFYNPSTQGNNKETKNLIDQIQKALIEKMSKALHQTITSIDFSTGKMTVDYSKTMDPLKIGTSSSTKKFTNAVPISDLESKKAQLETKIEELVASPQTDKVIEIQNQMTYLKNLIGSYISSFQTVDENGVIKEFIQFKGPQKQTMINQLNEINRAWDAVTYITKIILSPEDLGAFFEKIIQLSQKGIDFITNSTVEKLIEELEKSTSGTESVDRGQLINIGKNFDLTDLSEDAVPIHKNIQFSITDTVSNKTHNFSYRIYDVFKWDSGKMDINFTLDENTNKASNNIRNQNFRISAKNWMGINRDRDFGNTSLLSGILRTTSYFENALAYGYQYTTWEEKRDSLKTYGNICAILDILIGYSQQTGYADTLVINDRRSKQIKVFSMHSLLDKIGIDITNNATNYIKVTNRFTGGDESKPLGEQTKTILENMAKQKIALLGSLLTSLSR